MWSLADASPARLSELAKELDASGRWASFLTPHEHQFFATALGANAQTWAEFLDGRIPCQLKTASADDASPVTIDVDPVTLAFRVRYMLWDTQLDRMSDDVPPKTAHLPPADESIDPERPLLTSTRQPAGRNDEEDYDDDDDDNDDDESEEGGAGGSNVNYNGHSVPPVLIVESKEEDSEPDPRGRLLTVQNCSKMYHTFDGDFETLQRYQRLQASDEQIDSRDEGQGERRGSNAHSSETSSIAALAKSAQFGSASLSLKHLLGTIESKWSEMHFTDIELRNLISDVRKNRSKWASEERIGQEELYEACEKVVQELRGTTEHSTAFLNKVNKRDAPNYYQVIKEPMDLNTVMRKLRAYQYNSKSDFVNDLNLIWQNCLTYNSDPRHFLRAHAIAMRKKTASLSPLIPDIKIRARAEVEAEAEEQERLRGLAQTNNKRKAGESEGGKGQKRKLGKAPAATTTATSNAVDEDAVASNDEAASPALSTAPSNNTQGDAAADFEHENEASIEREGSTEDPPRSATAPPLEGSETPAAADLLDSRDSITTPRPDEQGDADSHGPAGEASQVKEEDETSSSSDKNAEDDGLLTPIEEEYKVPDVETVVWNAASKRRKLECISNRRALFVDNKLQMDAEIDLRRPGVMARFDNAIKSEDVVGLNSGISLLSVDPGEEPFLVEYEVNAGLPSQPLEDKSAWLTAPLPHPNDLAPTRYISSGSLSDLINKNLNEMQMIRRLCAKIVYIRDLRNGQVTQMPDPSLAAQPGVTAGQSIQEYPDVRDPEPDISSRLPGATRFDAKAAYSSMHRAAAKLAMHAGFEAAQPAAVDVLAEIAGDYLMKLGETLVAQLEAPGSTASFSSILRGSLNEMGVTKLDHLSRYIADDIVKQGKRLATFRTRLNTTLVEILRPEVDRYNDEQFKDNSDQFVMGQFSNELGDDYFGFKELGLEQELGVANIAIPFHLLRQRLVADQSAGISRSGGSDSDIVGLGVPEYPAPTPEDVLQLPTFLRQGLMKVLPKSVVEATESVAALADATIDGQAMTEEQAKSIEAQSQALAKAAAQAATARSKIPASGKLVARKKNISKAFMRSKPVKIEQPPPETEETSHQDSGSLSRSTQQQQQQHGEDGATPNNHQPDRPDAFDDTAADHFNLEDNITTGSLMLGGGDGDGGDASELGGAEGRVDTGEMDDLDISIPSFDF